jgi:hypothetical protein
MQPKPIAEIIPKVTKNRPVIQTEYHVPPNQHALNSLEQRRIIYTQQSCKISFPSKSTGELIEVDRFVLKGSWRTLRHGQQPNFRFNGPATFNELEKIGYRNCHNIVQALYFKLLNLRGNVLGAIIYDNMQPRHKQIVYQLLPDNTELFTDRLEQYISFKVV